MSNLNVPKRREYKTCQVESGPTLNCDSLAHTEGDGSLTYFVSIVSGIILSIFLSSFQALIPAHNVLEEPTYW